MTGHDFPLDAWCARVGVPLTGRAGPERLEAMQRAQLLAIPFGNLDIQLGRGIDLDPPHLVDKLLHRRRGGYCFELNGLFLMALEAAGFEARPLLGRVHLTGEPTGRSHQVTLVSSGGRERLVDVGFGAATPRVPMPLEPGVERDHDGIPYRLVEHPLGWLLQRREGEAWRDLYSFDLAPVVPMDIVYGNHFTSTSRRSFFTTSRVVARHHEDGVTTLFNYRLTVRRGGVETTETVPDSPAYLEVLAERFGIELDAPYGALRAVAENRDVGEKTGT